MNIPKAPYSARLEFWRFQYASHTFGQVETICDFILKHEISSGNPLHIPLITSLYVLYGRPFKQKGLSEDFVPNEYKDSHTSLITMRDKMHAHTDVNGPKSTEGELFNKVEVLVRDRKVQLAATVVFPKGVQIERISVLVRLLERKTYDCAVEIWKQYVKDELIHDGDYEVNLSKEDDSFLKPSSW